MKSLSIALFALVMGVLVVSIKANDQAHGGLYARRADPNVRNVHQGAAPTAAEQAQHAQARATKPSPFAGPEVRFVVSRAARLINEWGSIFKNELAKRSSLTEPTAEHGQAAHAAHAAQAA